MDTAFHAEKSSAGRGRTLVLSRSWLAAPQPACSHPADAPARESHFSFVTPLNGLPSDLTSMNLPSSERFT